MSLSARSSGAAIRAPSAAGPFRLLAWTSLVAVTSGCADHAPRFPTGAHPPVVERESTEEPPALSFEVLPPSRERALELAREFRAALVTRSDDLRDFLLPEARLATTNGARSRSLEGALAEDAFRIDAHGEVRPLALAPSRFSLEASADGAEGAKGTPPEPNTARDSNRTPDSIVVVRVEPVPPDRDGTAVDWWVGITSTEAGLRVAFVRTHDGLLPERPTAPHGESFR